MQRRYSALTTPYVFKHIVNIFGDNMNKKQDDFVSLRLSPPLSHQ
jgi:hypothetical protein